MGYRAQYTPPGWRCSECGAETGYYNYTTQVCSEECGRARKTRLQRERRVAARNGKPVQVRFKARYTGSQ